MTQALSFRNVVLFIACLLLASGSAFAFDGPSATSDSATWNVNAAYGSELSVAGPSGINIRKAFGAGSIPTFSIWDKAGYALPDGLYKWQLVLNGEKRERGEAAGAPGEIFSGAFRIESGSLTMPSAGGGRTDNVNKDQVIVDDLIVDGSICAGFDCVNGESFGADTLRLKENNLRIHFDDTSNSGSFPSNDWRIVTNDQSNGGKSYFSVEDSTAGRTPFLVEAGSIANALYVDVDGDVGIGTDQPVVELHAVDGNTPTLRLEQNGSSGFTPQTWDLAGNEANFFIRDVTNGSKLPFRIEPNTAENTLYLDSSSNVGVGTNAPGADFHVRDTGTTFPNDHAEFMMESNGVQWKFRSNGSTGDFAIIDNDASTTPLALTASGVLSVTSTCIEMATLACTASDGSGFSCVVGSCP